MASGSKPGDDTSAKRYNDILSIIDKRLVPDEGAKRARGEVFTPLKLVREMILGLRKSAVEKGHNEIWGFDEEEDTFRDDDETDRLGGIPLSVLRDPTMTWLDPANGIGNFPVVVFYILDYQLGKHGSRELKGDGNKTKRRKHIVEKMLYMIELNKGNVNTSRKIFQKLAPGAKSNICCADTLKMTDIKLKREFGFDKFDVVMGNPPFNNNLEANPSGHAQDTGLWEEFVTKSIDVFLKKSTGLLAFLHPARWRQPDHSLHAIMFSKQFLFLAIFNKQEGDKQFNAVTRFDYYILQNRESKEKVPVKFEDNSMASIYINNKTPFISNFGYDIWENIMNANIDTLDVLGGGSAIKYSKADHAIEDECPKGKPFLNVNTTAKTDRVPKGATYRKTRKQSNTERSSDNKIYVDMVCSSKEHPLKNKKKVIFSKNEVVYPFYDDGTYGLTSNAFCILVSNKTEGDIIVKYLNSTLLKFLIASVKFGNFSTAKNIFDYIPNPLLFDRTYSDKNMYAIFKFNKEQIRQITGHTIELEENENTEEEAPVHKKAAKSGKTRRLSR